MIINEDFLTLEPEDFDQTIEGLESLITILSPLLLKINNNGRGLEDAAEFGLAMQIARDAVLEIKQQIYGVEVTQDADN